MDNDKELNDEQYRAQLAKVFLSYNRSVIDDILGKSTHYKSSIVHVKTTVWKFMFLIVIIYNYIVYLANKNQQHIYFP